MSAFGGIVSMERPSVACDALLEMSRSMLLRGRDQRGAYIHGGMGIVHNRLLAGEPRESRQPFSLERNGKNYTVVFDGQLSGCGDLTPLFSDMGDESPAELILEAYLAFGSSFIGSLQGPFALAICDEARGEILLARDREGHRPLFYAIEDDRLLFASEIKGLLRGLTGPIRIDVARLRTHILSPCGTLHAEDLYRDIRAIPAGYCGIYSRMGLHLFEYEKDALTEECPPTGAIPCAHAVCPEGDALRALLTELLFAFDYPQFDDRMPSFLAAIDEARHREARVSFAIEDSMLCTSIPYARERADRLGAMRGVSVLPIAPKTHTVRERERKRIDRALTSLLASADQHLLEQIFGTPILDTVRRERNTEKRIRMQGLLCQSLLWLEHYPILFG